MAQSVEQSTQAWEESDLHFGPFRLEKTKRLWREESLVDVRPQSLAVQRTDPSVRLLCLGIHPLLHFPQVFVGPNFSGDCSNFSSYSGADGGVLSHSTVGIQSLTQHVNPL
jgi:hypothetical protein